ncbi:molybdenum cofactor guanylyltransferase [Cyanobacterium stanieri LEGE 03274]|uniref:Molybdenum cofactor guanylyltransferase n=1 Tax=Cyanobacterium stanieri LEGE 03274 TaxID=1828756 RepID=A0ABR9V851_9CHRO|nr:molybdenum cofactor guanylyltransferase [Cyanobacterium stanieri]MBE9223696.1 molybdenum cofactor guanylyltransferase [Cyanobacterium stanieri LEGE 03274]
MISVLILAGGKSSRMGFDKALIEIEGEYLLSKTYHIARELSNEVFILTSPEHQYQSFLPNDTQFIIEPHPYQGPLVAFAHGLSFIHSPWVLLLPCDLIYLQTQEIKSWLKLLPSVSEETIALLPTHKKGWECLSGFYRRDCLSSLQKSLNGGNKSFQRWLKGEKVTPLMVQDRRVLYNCNTPEDLAKWTEYSSFGDNLS